jgi:ankyrin repeat protein
MIIKKDLLGHPDEIIIHILSFIDNHKLMKCRLISNRFKKLIENKFFIKRHIPTIEQCIINDDYYYFGKFYLNSPKNDYQQDLSIVSGNKIFMRVCKIGTLTKFFNKVYAMASINRLFKDSLDYPYDVTKYLISKGANIHIENDYVLRKACENGHLETVEYLLKMGADVHVEGAIILAATNGHIEIIKLLLNYGADIHAKNDKALLLSAKNGHLEIVKLLLDKGANIHVKEDNYDAIRLSIKFKKLDVFKYLLETGACTYFNKEELLSECINKYSYFDDIILTMFNLLINEKTNIPVNYNKLLINCITHDSDLKFIDLLLQKGADIHVHNDMALIKNIMNCEIHRIKFLLEKGADIHAQNDNATKLTIRYGDIRMLKLLIEFGGNLHADNDLAFINCGSIEMMTYLLENEKFEQSILDKTLVSVINTQLRYSRFIDLLLKHGANPHANNEEAIIACANKGYYDQMRKLNDWQGN